jgi:hypothetical protein
MKGGQPEHLGTGWLLVWFAGNCAVTGRHRDVRSLNGETPSWDILLWYIYF